MRTTTRTAITLALTAALGANAQLDTRADTAEDRAGQASLVHDAQPNNATPIDPPELSPAVIRALEAPYLTDDERARLRVFHGLWTDADLEDPNLRALAATIAHDWYDPVFSEQHRTLPGHLLARAHLGTGTNEMLLLRNNWVFHQDLTVAQQLAGDLSLLTSSPDAAIAYHNEALDHFNTTDAPTPEAAVAAAKSIRGLVRLGERDDQAAAYREMMSILARVHQEQDRLHWPALVLEAELLAEKHNWQAASEAALAALSLNPRAAAAWAVLGNMAAAGFDKGRADAIAARLERIAASVGGEPAISIDAALIRSRERIRSDDPEGARAALEPFADRATPPAIHARRVAVEALSYDTQRIENALARMSVNPVGNDEPTPHVQALALYEAGRTLSDRRQYELATHYLNRAIELAPHWAEPLSELGLMELQAGNDAAALRALERAVGLDPFDVRASNSLTLARELITWPTIESDHFIVRHAPGVDAVLAREMIDELERTHDEVVAALGHTPARKTTLELMPDKERFAVRVTGMPSIFTMAASTGPVVAMETPRQGPLHTGEYNWLQVFRHEYVHTVTLAMTRNRIPHWFTEAAAVHLEGVPREGRRWRMLTEAWKNNALLGPERINLGFIRPKNPAERSLAYAQSEWMYEFMLERWGPNAPADLMLEYAKGTREPDAFQTVLSVSPDEFHAQFRAWAGEQLHAVGMLTSPTVEHLLIDETLRDDVLNEQAHNDLRLAARALADAAASISTITDSELDLALSPRTIALDPATLAVLLAEHPDHPGLLEHAVKQRLQQNHGTVTPDDTELLERYAAARPADPEPHRLLALFYLEQGQPDRATPHLEFLDDREVSTGVYAVELARRYADRGRWNDAIDKVERATRVSPFDATLRELAAEAALRAQNLERARHHILALTDIEPDRDIHKRRLQAIERLAEANE